MARKTYYSNPVPDEFYTGNEQSEEHVGQPENYYAFQWGDALYVAIDPYRYTLSEPYNGTENIFLTKSDLVGESLFMKL